MQIETPEETYLSRKAFPLQPNSTNVAAIPGGGEGGRGLGVGKRRGAGGVAGEEWGDI